MNTLRIACQEDLSALLDLYVQLNPANASVGGIEHFREVGAQIRSDPKIHCFVVEAQGVLIGSCILAILPNLTRSARPFGVVENVVTHCDYRRQGVGTQLMRHALEVAWDADCYKVMLMSGAGREEAHQFYEHLGFNRDSKVGFVATPTPLFSSEPHP